MMKKLGANALWSCFSLKGRKGKRALGELRLHRVIIKACQRNFRKATEQQIEDEVGEFLKHAPHRSGGPKHKVKTATLNVHPPPVDRLSSDSD